MAQPPVYNRAHNFTSALAGTAFATLGPLLDAEFTAAHATIAATRSNIGQIQRDDLRLKNRSVEADTLGDTVLALIADDGLKMRGDWAPAAAYAAGDLVVSDAKIWMVKTTHTSAASIQTDIVAGRVVGPVFDPELQIQFDSVVTYETWAELAAVSGTPGSAAVVLADAGTHTDPVAGGTVSNTGTFAWKVGPPTGWKRIGDTQAALASASATLAQAWAESASEPGGAGTKSAKTHAAEAGAHSAAAGAAATAAINAMPVIGPWSDWGTLTIPAGLTTVRVRDTLGSVNGTASFEVKLDSQQTEFTTAMTAMINTAVSLGQTLANAQADARAAQAMWRKQDAQGRWWVENETNFTLAMAGCPGDGNMSSLNVVTGTLVTATVQNWINYHIFIKKTRMVASGRHRVGPLYFGWGDGFIGFAIDGGATNFDSGSAFPGLTWIQDDWRQPIMFINGGRKVEIANISFRGPYSRHMTDNLLGFTASAPGALDDMVDSNWNMPALPTTQNNRYNPHGLVAIDAFCGTRPTPVARANATAYAYRDTIFTGGNVYFCEVAGTSGTGTAPTGTDPTALYTDGTAVFRWLGAYDAGTPHALTSYPDMPIVGNRWCTGPNQYGRNNYSSDTLFRRCLFRGGVFGAISTPSNNSLQNDFCRFEFCTFIYNRFPDTSGNDQDRSRMHHGCDFALYHTAHTNDQIGTQRGQPQLTSVGCSYGAGIYMLNYNMSYGGSATFYNAYCEAQRRLGVIAPTNTADTGIHFINPKLDFGANAERGRVGRIMHLRNFPTEVLTGGGTRDIRFVGGLIGFYGALPIFVDGVSFQGTMLYDFDTGASTVAPWMAQMLQATSGGLFFPSLNYWRHGDQAMRFPLHRVDTGATVNIAAQVQGAYHYSDRLYTIPFAVRSVRPASSTVEELLAVPHDSGTPTTYTINGTTVTATNGPNPCEISIVVTGANKASTCDRQGFGPGGVAVHVETGTCFGIRNFNDGTDTAILVPLNNFRVVGGVRQWIVAPGLVNGERFIFRRGNFYTPARPVFFDCVAAGANMTNMGNSAGVGTTLTADMTNGDYIITSSELDAMFGTTHTITIGTITNGSPGSAVASTNFATGKGATHRRLPFLRIPAAPNA